MGEREIKSRARKLLQAKGALQALYEDYAERPLDDYIVDVTEALSSGTHDTCAPVS